MGDPVKWAGSDLMRTTSLSSGLSDLNLRRSYITQHPYGFDEENIKHDGLIISTFCLNHYHYVTVLLSLVYH